MSASRNQKFAVSTNSRSSNSIDKVIIKWLRAKYPKEMSKHSFTSIQINSDFSAMVHRDRHNDGMSLNTVIGNYNGGNLL